MFTTTVIKMNTTKKGKQFGFWLNDREIEETQIESKVEESGGNISQYIKNQLEEIKTLKTALKDLYEFMGSDIMTFTTDKLSPRDLKFIEYIAGLIKGE